MGAGVINVDMKDILSNAGSIFSGFGDLLKDIRTAITGKAPIDPNKALELEAKILEAEGKLAEYSQQLSLAQVELNKIEAASPSMFKSGWRPAAGWTCVSGLIWATFIVPFWIWLAAICKLPCPPAVDTGVLISLLIAMLGLGVYRTYEKTRSNGK